MFYRRNSFVTKTWPKQRPDDLNLSASLEEGIIKY